MAKLTIRKERYEGTTFWYVYEGPHAVFESPRKIDCIKFLRENRR